MESDLMEETRFAHDHVGRHSSGQALESVSAYYPVSLRPHIRLQGKALFFHDGPEGPHGRVISNLHSHHH